MARNFCGLYAARDIDDVKIAHNILRSDIIATNRPILSKKICQSVYICQSRRVGATKHVDVCGGTGRSDVSTLWIEAAVDGNDVICSQ